MSLRIGDEVPDFTAQTTEGEIRFHEWIGNGWAVLFSHPKDFTPVCTTELGYLAKLKPEFDKRNTKVIGLSIDSVEDHRRWAADIAETQGTPLNYPLIGDTDLKVAKLYDMIHPGLQRSAARPRFGAVDGPPHGGDAGQLAAGRRRDHPDVRFGRRRTREIPERLEDLEVLPQDRRAAEIICPAPPVPAVARSPP